MGDHIKTFHGSITRKTTNNCALDVILSACQMLWRIYYIYHCIQQVQVTFQTLWFSTWQLDLVEEMIKKKGTTVTTTTIYPCLKRICQIFLFIAVEIKIQYIMQICNEPLYQWNIAPRSDLNVWETYDFN